MAITKPLVIDKAQLDWDTLELLETVQAAVQGGDAPKFADLKRLIAGLFVGWTVEDAGKITQAESTQIFEAVKEQLALPNASATSSSPPSTTAA